ncbi:MAG: ABC transporter permease [Chloroflexi bacterium OLB13]|nr:MAG: ABC transporter permease [Chloroflexi bacterium OLB13]
MDYSSTARARTSISTQVYLIAGLMLLLGVGALWLFVTGITDALMHRAAGADFGAVLLRYLHVNGIILPLIELGLGLYLIRLAARFLRRDLRAAMWVRQLLLWGVVASTVFVVQALGSALATQMAATEAYMIPVIGVILALTLTYAYLWIGSNIEKFEGQETLAESSARFAWNLLVPTLLVLVFVALRPLEKTFIASLTDQRFAAGADAEVNFVGFDNYAKLLGVRWDLVQCTTDDTGACAVDESGATVFPRARDVLDETYRDLRYREISTWLTLGGTKLIFSARDTNFIGSIGNTLMFTVVSVTIELILGIFIAMVINSKFPGRGLMRAAMLVPWAIPTVVSAKLWTVILRDNSSGILNAGINLIQRTLGLPEESIAWLARPETQIIAMIAIDVWKTTPFMALILLAGLQTIPADIYEAADVDGANRITQFLRLTIPLLRPTIAVALVFRTLDAVRVFDVFQVVLAQKQYSMATYNYYTLTNSQQLGYASAVGVVIFVIILLFTVAYVRILGVSAE